MGLPDRTAVHSGPRHLPDLKVIIMISASAAQRMGLKLVLSFAVTLMVGCSPADKQEHAEEVSAQGPAANTKPASADEPASTGAKALAPVRKAVAELPVLKSSTACNIDQFGAVGSTILASSYTKADGPLSVGGWIVREDGQGVPTNVWLRLEDTAKQYVWEIDVPVGGIREDVAQARSNPALANSGFSALVDMQGIPIGRFHLYLAYQVAGGEFGCDNGVQFDVY